MARCWHRAREKDIKHDGPYEKIWKKKKRCNELCRRGCNAWSRRRQRGLHEAPEWWWCAVKTAWKSVCWARWGALRSDMMPRVDYLFKTQRYVVDMSARPSLTSQRLGSLLRLLVHHGTAQRQTKKRGGKKGALNGYINSSFNQGSGCPTPSLF